MPPGFSVKKEMVIWLIIVAPIIYLLTVLDQLPDQIPTHWNFKGEVDGYGSPFVLPLLNVGVYLLLLFIPLLDPKRKNYEFFANAYYKIRLALALFLSTLTVMIILVGLGHDIKIDRVVIIGTLVLFAALGNYLTTVKPNWFVGFRTPWTLENEDVWRKTHLLGGRLWFGGGLLGIILAFFLPQSALVTFAIVTFSVLGLIPVVYSYISYQKQQ